MSKIGIVKRWDDDRGFGFIGQDGGQADIFVHRTCLMGHVNMLNVGDKVSYDAIYDDRKQKFQAITCHLVESVVPSPRLSGGMGQFVQVVQHLMDMGVPHMISQPAMMSPIGVMSPCAMSSNGISPNMISPTMTSPNLNQQPMYQQQFAPIPNQSSTGHMTPPAANAHMQGFPGSPMVSQIMAVNTGSPGSNAQQQRSSLYSNSNSLFVGSPIQAQFTQMPVQQQPQQQPQQQVGSPVHRHAMLQHQHSFEEQHRPMFASTQPQGVAAGVPFW